MTFWQDARPIAARSRERHASRVVARGWRRRRRWIVAGRIVVLLLVPPLLGVWIASVDPGGSPPRAGAGTGTGGGAARTLESRWAHTAGDEPQELVADESGAVLLGSRSVAALDVRDGTERWRASLDRPNRFVAVDPSTVVVSLADGFAGFDRATGTRRFTVSTPETPGPVALVTPPGEPSLAIVQTDEGGLAGLEARTGVTRWSSRLDGLPRGTPGAGGSAVALVTEASETRLTVVEAVTGAVRWQRSVPAGSGSPVVAGDAVILGAGDGDRRSAVRAFGLVDGTERWRTRVDASFQPGLVPTVEGDDVFVVDQLGYVVRLDLASGRRRWRRPLGEAVLLGSPAVAGETVLVTDYAREIVSIDRRTGRLWGRYRATGMPMRVAALSGLVLVAQRLVTSEQLEAYSAGAFAPGPVRGGRAAPARSRS